MALRRHARPSGSGSAYANDRLEPAAAMADSGRVAYIGFDCLAERTMALAQVRRRRDPPPARTSASARWCRCSRATSPSGRKVVGNFGAANPDARLPDFVAGPARRRPARARGSA